MPHEKTMIAISLGGSLIVPDGIDTSFLKQFKKFIEAYVEEGHRFLIVTGGGRTARRYQDAASMVATIDDEDKDWLGIHCTRINAHLMRTIFKEHAHPKIYSKEEELDPKEILEPIVIGAGSKPGWSSDFVTVSLAEILGITKIINLSNMTHVYSSDPREDKGAEPLDQLSWEEYRKIIPEVWRPGLSSPFDPIASKKAAEMGLEVAIIDGYNTESIRHCIEGKAFEGTWIK